MSPSPGLPCLRCGNCCGYWRDSSKLVWVECRWLVRLSNGRCYCRSYRNRLGRVIGVDADGVKYYCCLRSDIRVNFPGCPNNRPSFKDYSLLGVMY